MTAACEDDHAPVLASRRKSDPRPPVSPPQARRATRQIRTTVPVCGDTKSGAVEDENGLITSDLASVIKAWDSLPPDTRTAILAIVAAAQGR